MKKAQAWIEEVTYVECPDCGQSIELGSGVLFTEAETEEHCQKCGCNFLILEPV